MKLRIKGNSVRLRLSQSEVTLLAQGQFVQEVTKLSPIDSFTYTLQPWSLQIAHATLEGQSLTVKCPETDIQTWAEGDTVSLAYVQDNGSVSPLQILIEKDFTCLKPRADEDETDLFANPSTGAKC